jgi:very-short-patch-repair endonuclease
MYFKPKVVYPNPKTDKKNSVIRYIGNRVLRQNKNFLCLSGDTKLYGQEKTLAELYNSGDILINTLSLTKAKDKPGTYYPIKSKSQIIPSGQKEVFEIELENGKKVYATSEHKFFKKHKNTFEESKVKDLKIGDSLRDFDIEYLKKFYDKANQRSQNNLEDKYNPKKICFRCKSLFYVNRYSGCKSKLYCNSCSEELGKKHRLKKYRKDVWYEWEDNLLRNFYYNKKKEYIMQLIPNHNWKAIKHRAKRIGLSNKRRKIYNFSISKMTSIEKKVADILDKNNIKYEFNKVINNNGKLFFPDFTIGKVIIECDGKHWHKNREEQDIKRQKELERLGYIILRFSEDKINNNQEEIEQCIAQRLNQ